MGGNLLTLITLLATLGVLVLVMRWASRSSHRPTGRPVDAADSTDLGMLHVISPGLPRAEAMQIRARLSDGGVRTSLSRRRDGHVDVLVFYDDAPRARVILGP